MNKPKKVTQTVPISCPSARVVADVESWQYPDTAKDIDALDRKSDARNFRRLLRYFIRSFARRHGMTPEKLCEVVPKQEMRAALRKAMERYQPGPHRFTTYVSWWFWLVVRRYLPRPSPTLVQKPFTTGEGR